MENSHYLVTIRCKYTGPSVALVRVISQTRLRLSAQEVIQA